MMLTTLTQSPDLTQSATTIVREYSLVVINPQDDNTQKLTAAFDSLPTPEDWKDWLDSWSSTGYQLQSSPQLICII